MGEVSQGIPGPADPSWGAQCWQEGLQGRAGPLSLAVFSDSALMGIAFIQRSLEPVFWIKYNKNKCINHS